MLTRTSDLEGGETAGVIAPPPVIFLGFLLAGWGLGQAIDGRGLGLEPRVRHGLAFAFVIGGLIVEWAAVSRMRRAKTPPEPWKPTTALVTDGFYALSRNPIYVGFAFIYVGFAVAMDGAIALALILPCLVLIDRGVVAREETYLAARFGPDWTDYARRVRRWI